MLAVVVDCFHLHATIFEVIGRNLRARASERASQRSRAERERSEEAIFAEPAGEDKVNLQTHGKSYPCSTCGHCCPGI